MKAIVLFVLIVLSAFSTTVSFAQESCSSGGTLEEMLLTISNDTDKDVTIHWIDDGCIEVEGTPIAAGENYEFTTYDGHEFVFRDTDGNQIAAYVAAVADNNATLLVSTLIAAYSPEKPVTCSSSGTFEEMLVTFDNDTGGDVTIHWIDENCVEQEGSPIAAGTQYEFTTYDGHEFIFRDAEGSQIGNYTAVVADNGQVLPISGYVEQWIDIEPEVVAEPTVDSVVVAPGESEARGLPVTLNGTLASDVESNSFTLEAQAEIQYVIYMASTDFDTYVIVRDANNEEVAWNDDINLRGGNLNSLLVFVPPTSGTYTIAIDSYVEGAAGDYTFSIATPDTRISSYYANTIGATDTTFEVEAGTSYFVFANSDEIDTTLTVLDETGAEVAMNDDSGNDGTNSFVWFEAQSTGTYTLRVAGYDAIKSGTFELLTGAFAPASAE